MSKGKRLRVGVRITGREKRWALIYLQTEDSQGEMNHKRPSYLWNDGHPWMTLEIMDLKPENSKFKSYAYIASNSDILLTKLALFSIPLCVFAICNVSLQFLKLGSGVYFSTSLVWISHLVEEIVCLFQAWASRGLMHFCSLFWNLLSTMSLLEDEKHVVLNPHQHSSTVSQITDLGKTILDHLEAWVSPVMISWTQPRPEEAPIWL